MPIHRPTMLPALLLISLKAGCGSSLAEVDVECKRLCLAEPGPTIPGVSTLALAARDAAGIAVDSWLAKSDGGLAGAFDAAIPGAVGFNFEWIANMNFNEVLAQWPSSAMSLSANLRLTSIALSSTRDLDFIESLEVLLSHGEARALGGTRTLTMAADAGLADDGLGCRNAGATLRVASFQRAEGWINGPTVALVVANPELNLFDCMKDEPSQFHVTLRSRPGGVPASDAPLTLGTCIGANTHLSYP
jgi:hypothetical protein